MGWFTPVDRNRHPCITPMFDETERHRKGEYWRCEVCGYLWRYTGGASFAGVRQWWVRWIYRNQGYSTDD